MHLPPGDYLEVNSSNTLSFNESNSIIIDEDTLKQVMVLAEQDDLEREIQHVRDEQTRVLNEMQRRARQADAEYSYQQRANQVAALNEIDWRSRVPTFTSSPAVGAFGGYQHRMMGSAWVLAAQTRSLMAYSQGMYAPSIVAQNCMRIFPQAGMMTSQRLF